MKHRGKCPACGCRLALTELDSDEHIGVMVWCESEDCLDADCSEGKYGQTETEAYLRLKIRYEQRNKERTAPVINAPGK